MGARRLGRRPELLLLAALLLVVAVLPDGLPLGIVGIGVVFGSLLSLHAMGVVLLYSRTRILSFAQFGLGAAAAVLFYLWVQYNQWAVLADGVCRCLAPDGLDLGDLQHNPDPYREWLLQHLGESLCRKLGVYRVPDDLVLSVVIPVYNEITTIREMSTSTSGANESGASRASTAA